MLVCVALPIFNRSTTLFALFPLTFIINQMGAAIEGSPFHTGEQLCLGNGGLYNHHRIAPEIIIYARNNSLNICHLNAEIVAREIQSSWDLFSLLSVGSRLVQSQ